MSVDTEQWAVIVALDGELTTSPEFAGEILSMAIALDTTEMVIGAGRVARVIVVSAKGNQLAFHRLGADTVDPAPTDDVPAAVELAVDALPTGNPVAVLRGSLPTTTAEELDHALVLASHFPSAIATDRRGQRVVLETFGENPRIRSPQTERTPAAYRAAGFHDLVIPANAGLRHRVTSAGELREVLASCGRRTIRAAAMLGLSAATTRTTT